MTQSRSPINAASKTIATLAARFALAGGGLTFETGIDGRTRYLVALRGRVRPFDNIGQLEILADLIEGAL